MTEARTAFLEKRSKRLVIAWPCPSGGARLQRLKVFWFFFSKKNRLLPDQHGVVALVTALLLPLLLGAIGLGVEASAWTYQTVQLQRTADVAALAAARVLNNGATAAVAAAAALDVAELNGISAAPRSWNAGAGTLSDAYATAQLVSGIRASRNPAFKVTVLRQITPVIAALFLGRTSLTLTASAWAEVVQVAANTPQPCILGLATETAPGTVLGVNLNGGSGLNTGACAIRANADVQVVGAATTTTAAIYSGGTISVGGGARVQASGGAAASLSAANDIDIGYSFGGGSNGSGTVTGNASAAGNINVNGSSTITGVADAGGSITVNSSTIDGATSAAGNLTMNSGLINAATTAGGTVTLNAGTISGAVADSGPLTLNNGASISGPISAAAVTVNVGTITGAVNTSGTLAINSGSRVIGNVDAASIAISNGTIQGNTISTTQATTPAWESSAISGTQSLGRAGSAPAAPSAPGSPGTISDPYASNAAVAAALAGLGGASPGGAINVQWSPAPVVLQPGTYSSITTNFWSNFGSTPAVTFAPGTYYVNGNVSLSGYVAGSGVTIVASGTVQIGAGAVSLTAPLAQAAGGVPGMLLIGTTTSAVTLISGGNTATLAGVIYFPHAPLTVTGGVTATSANCLEVIAATVTITGGSSLGGTCQSFGAASFAATPALTTVALVQ